MSGLREIGEWFGAQARGFADDVTSLRETQVQEDWREDCRVAARVLQGAALVAAVALVVFSSATIPTILGLWACYELGMIGHNIEHLAKHPSKFYSSNKTFALAATDYALLSRLVTKLVIKLQREA